MYALIAVISGYILGCFNSGYYVTRWKTGADIRQLHSGTAGATNVARVLGKKFAVIVLLLDALKSFLAVGVNLWISDDLFCAALALFMGVVGHIYPVQLSFDGGKGLAATWGGMWLISWEITAAMSVVAVLCHLRIHKNWRGIIIVVIYMVMTFIQFYFDGAGIICLLTAILLLFNSLPQKKVTVKHH